MLLGVIADDFTGASDIANTIAQGLPGEHGLSTALFLGIPESPAPSEIESGVVALKTRSTTPEDAVGQALSALDWLKRQGCRQTVFKYCSTFDSTPKGNIGPVGEALAQALGVRGVVACPAFPSTGRTVYQGHLFVRDRLLNESGLQDHPLNPMTDPDIRRWLRHQTSSPVGLLPLAVVRSGKARLQRALRSSEETLVIVDAISDEDLVRIGRASRNAPLITGGSGIALALPSNFIAAGLATGARITFSGMRGPGVIISGSCSEATRKQVEIYASAHPSFWVTPESVVSGRIVAEDIASFALDHLDDAPLLYSSSSPDHLLASQRRYGAERVARSLESVFAKAASLLVEGGVTRLVVAGGETSGAVASVLRLSMLRIGPEIDPGVPALSAIGEPGLALALKSGNFGGPDFFERALEALARDI